MELQTVVALLIAAAAAGYLVRYVYLSVRAIVHAKSGCGGCANCAFARGVESAGSPSLSPGAGQARVSSRAAYERRASGRAPSPPALLPRRGEGRQGAGQARVVRVSEIAVLPSRRETKEDQERSGGER